MKPIWFALLLIAISPSVVAAQDSPPLTYKDVKVEKRDLSAARFFPEAAARKGIGGQADVICTILAEGDLTNCTVTAESPSNLGFGEAALKFAKGVRVAQTANDGSPSVGRRFLTHMNFGLPK